MVSISIQSNLLHFGNDSRLLRNTGVHRSWNVLGGGIIRVRCRRALDDPAELGAALAGDLDGRGDAEKGGEEEDLHGLGFRRNLRSVS